MPAAAQQSTIVSSANSGSEPLAMPWSSEPNTDLDHVDEPEHTESGTPIGTGLLLQQICEIICRGQNRLCSRSVPVPSMSDQCGRPAAVREKPRRRQQGP